jgi:hypothetical protein
MKEFNFVYKTENLLNSKIYVGKRSSDTLEDGYLGSGKLLLKAIRRHGKENFRRDILQFCGSEEEAYLAEGLIVDQDFVAREDTYNLKCGGEGGLRGFHHREESKEKSRKSNKDKKRSPETCRNISEAHKGIKYGPPNEEIRAKISAALLGGHLTEEQCSKISASKIGKKMPPRSDEYRKAISERMQGKSPASNKDISSVTCPHCGKIGSKNPMKRWHFNNCKVLKSK